MGEEVKGCSNSVGVSGCCVYVDICIHIYSVMWYTWDQSLIVMQMNISLKIGLFSVKNLTREERKKKKKSMTLLIREGEQITAL